LFTFITVVYELSSERDRELMMKEVHIVGVGATRFGKFIDKSVKELSTEATDLAIKDCGADMAEIDVVFFSNATQSVMEGQHMIAGQVAMNAMGFVQTPVLNIENACASGSTALHAAAAHIKAGFADVALVVGVDKMHSPDKQRSMSLFDGAVDVHAAAETDELLEAMCRGAPPAPATEIRSKFMDIYAALARFHMSTYGTTQRQLAVIAAKNHRHSTMNPLAQYTRDFTVEEVLHARLVSWPLTLPMCSPIGDGAAAVVLCSSDALKRFDRHRAVRLCGSALSGGSRRKPDELDRHVGRIAANKAYEQAGVGPKDMSVAEVHDATSFAEIQQVENLGFCELGDGGALAESGATSLGGKIPVNPSGGLVSKGHPIGATGLSQIHELTLQLRGEAGRRQVANARFGIAENGGGFVGVEEAVVCVTILGK